MPVAQRSRHGRAFPLAVLRRRLLTTFPECGAAWRTTVAHGLCAAGCALGTGVARCSRTARFRVSLTVRYADSIFCSTLHLCFLQRMLLDTSPGSNVRFGASAERCGPHVVVLCPGFPHYVYILALASEGRRRCMYHEHRSMNAKYQFSYPDHERHYSHGPIPFIELGQGEETKYFLVHDGAPTRLPMTRAQWVSTYMYSSAPAAGGVGGVGGPTACTAGRTTCDVDAASRDHNLFPGSLGSACLSELTPVFSQKQLPQ